MLDKKEGKKYLYNLSWEGCAAGKVDQGQGWEVRKAQLAKDKCKYRRL